MTDDDRARLALIQRILGTLAELGRDELRVIADIASRLLMGQRQYGELDIDADPRDWDREGYDEGLDQSVYLTVSLLRRLSRKGQ